MKRKIWIAMCLLLIAACFTGCGGSGQQQRAESMGLGDAKVVKTRSGYTVYQLTFQRDDLDIYGQLYLPAGDKKTYPTVIIGHGYGSTCRNSATDSKAFAKAGIASFAFDFCGGSEDSSSDGSMDDMTVFTESADMEAVLEGIRTYGFVDTDNVFLMGKSLGGQAAALLAPKKANEIKGMVLFYPYMINMGGRDFDLFGEIAKYKEDVLIVQGSEDKAVPVELSRKTADTYSSARLIEIDGAGHGFRDDEDRGKADDAAVDYILEKVRSTKEEGTQKTQAGGEEEMKIEMQAGEETFSVSLSDNPTAQAFAELLPMAMDMQEMNGNEKFYDLPQPLPADAQDVGNIRAGDLMLYGSDCVVLFYEGFPTTYRYTRLGRVEDVSGLKRALGNGDVQMAFQ